MNVQLEDRSCPLGCSYNDQILFSGRDLLHHLPGEFKVVKCEGCGLIRTNPRPTSESIGYYYPDDYGPYQGTRVIQKPGESGWLKSQLKPLASKVINFNATVLPDIPKGRMLEIGCASGAFMHKMAGEGWHVTGIEFSPDAAEATRSLGYQVHTGQLEAAPDPIELYDLIVGWMVLEHLHDPVAGLNKLFDWAKPDATLALSIPNVRTFQLRVFKEKWYDLHLPNHLYHFNPETIEKLLQSCGWKVEKIHHQRTLANLLSSTGYVLQEKGHEWLGKKFLCTPKYTNYIMYPIAWLFSLFGQTGRMTIWAKKEGL
jgi:2-polyprenyl-3-methyl-5-hydroxy-6-metoxy-1,4-benzoquinol methylase